MEKRVKKRSNDNYKRTLIVTFVLSFISVIIATQIQLIGQKGLSCSYLDPITIDIFALLLSIFLIIEGLARINEHKSASLKRQFTRMIRISAGFVILTLHIIQLVHK